MDELNSLFFTHFSRLDDPRLDRRKRHSLIDIIAIAVCAVIAGADSWTDVEDFGRTKEDWLRTFLKLPNGIPSHDTLDKGHGRVERRQYWYTHDVQGLGTLERWPKLAGMVWCRATRTEKGETSVDDRYFITSNTGHDVDKIAAAIRAHWRIENSLHWVLDITFYEDQCRVRLGYAAKNFSAIRKLALNALKANTSKKGSIRRKRKIAG